MIRNITRYSTQPDEELLQLFRISGDQDILAALFLRYYELVYGVALKYLAEAEDARDATMDIYAELVKKVPQHDIKIFRSWLYVFTRNHCLMRLRSNKSTDFVPLEADVVQSPDFLHLTEENLKEHTLTKLEDCIQALSGDQKKSVELFYLQNKSYNEIVQETGMEWNKIKSLIQNGRRNIKICMEQDGTT